MLHLLTDMVIHYLMRPHGLRWIRIAAYTATQSNEPYDRQVLEQREGSMNTSLFQQGMDLLVFGMGTVFLFLTLAVVCVTVMSKIIGKFFAEPEPAALRPKVAATPSQSSTPIDGKILAAIQDAIYQHRARNK